MPAAIDAPSTLTLDFVVVGGGIAGFSAAYVLAKAGHNVQVLEQLPGLGAPSGGLRIPPDMSKILEKWAGEEEVQRKAVVNTATPWYDLHTGEKVGVAQWKQSVVAETGGDFLLMKHEDVHRLLHKLAVDAGVKVAFGATVETVVPGDPKPTVKLSTGETFTADIVIGADGAGSVVRPVVLEQEDEVKPSGLTVFSAVIPTSEMMKDPDLAKFAQADEWPVMMGTGRSLCSHPIHSKEEYSIHMFWSDEYSGTPPEVAESWYDIVPTSSVDVSDICPVAEKLVKLAPELHRTRWMSRDMETDEWTDQSGRIVLIGEAAHPWLPGGTWGPAMAVEDAVVFGTLFSHITEWTQVPESLGAYQELRQTRTKAVLKADVANLILMQLPPGPERDARNVDLARTCDLLAEGNEEYGFGDLVGLFSYDAEDAAQEWWATWGRFYCRDSVRLTLESAAEAKGEDTPEARMAQLTI